jgi:hypothetical protein
VLSEREALTALRREDPDQAEDAAAALGWLSGERGLHSITQLRLAEFLWYALPVKWSIATSEQVRVARTLGRLFSLAGMDGYAAICASPLTAKILTVYGEQGHEAGLAAYAQAVQADGLEPPDTGALAWGSAMGPDEYAAYESCTAALELARGSGELRAGQRGAAARRAALVERWLAQPRPELGGDSWLGRVRTERLGAWSHGRYGEHARLAQQVAPRLLEPVPAPAGALPTLRWLLDHAREGLPLTARHYISPRLVTEAVERFGWRRYLVGTLTREFDVFPLHTLRHLAHREMGAIRRTGTTLVLTRTGRRMHDDTQAFWQTGSAALVGTEPPDKPDFAVAVREAALLVLLIDGPTNDDELSRRLAALLEWHGWRAQDTQTLADAAQHEIHDFRHRLWALDLLNDPRSLTRKLTLTDLGEAAALAALRTRALRPRHHVGRG